ncbi:hypothetical protein LZC95_26420 [Pendulispora brunnea]|uniref:DoxX family protein n=1 Tax=Pendulispora brunnea TaxID=2905690 RepID=A0ABZ2JXK9_9BACT
MTAEKTTQVGAWPLWKRAGFRFLFVYILLYWYPFPLGFLPGTHDWSAACQKPLYLLAAWVAKHILHVSAEMLAFNGSGDRTYNYVNLLDMVVLSAIAAIAWTASSHRRTNEVRLYAGLRLMVRYALGLTMVFYGLVKVIKRQFPDLPPDLLVQTFGETSPMTLLWSFMGYSTAYTFFAGASELLGGALLLFRRTTMLGALVSSAVMANVVMLNFSYDVPVKLFASHLLLMGIFLLWPDLPRLANMFLLHRPSPLRFDRPWMNYVKVGLKVFVIGGFVSSIAFEQWHRYRHDGDGAPKADFEGIYEIDSFTRNGEAVPPLLTERTRWRWLTRQRTTLVIRPVAGPAQKYRVERDEGSKGLTIVTSAKPDSKCVLTYAPAENGHIVFRANLGEDMIEATAHKVDESQFLLVNRGFHWINEKPLKN